MKPGLVPGMVGEHSLRVTPDVAIALGPAPGLTVYSTPAMISAMEQAAQNAVEPFLEEGETTVGADVSVRHLAPTPLGEKVRTVARVVSVEGRSLAFEIEAYSDAEKIGEGTHKRAVVSLSRLRERVERAKTPAPTPRPELTPEAYTAVTFQSEEGIGLITLNRESSLNAVNTAMVEELEDLLARLAEHAATRVVIITGKGRAFCAGDDVKELAGLTEHEAEHLSLRQARLYHRFHTIPQPIIAAVNGPALGAGCVCAAFCDLRVASFAATFGMPEIRLGWSPGYGNAQIMQLVGPGRTALLSLTGEPIMAQEAHRIGLAEQIVPHNNLMPSARELARKMLRLPPVALREVKQLLHQDAALNPNESYVNDTASYMRCFRTADAREGIAAFIEKRAPVWNGR